MNLKNEQGITMIALVITVIILTIIGAYSLNIVNNSTKSSKDASNLSELKMVQQAILERYTKYTLTKDNDILVGYIISEDEKSKLPEQLEILGQMSYTEGISEEKCYYILYNDSNNENYQYMKKLDIENTSNVYIVNYYTGEVMQVETEEIENTNSSNRRIVKTNITDNTSIAIKETSAGKYIIKETSEGELLYTYAATNI